MRFVLSSQVPVRSSAQTLAESGGVTFFAAGLHQPNKNGDVRYRMYVVRRFMYVSFVYVDVSQCIASYLLVCFPRGSTKIKQT